MSTTKYNGEKIVLRVPFTEHMAFWKEVQKRYAKGNERRWKYLSMLCLRVHSGWSLEMIGLAFGHPKGHVSRCLVAVKRDLLEMVGGDVVVGEYLQELCSKLVDDKVMEEGDDLGLLAGSNEKEASDGD